MNCLVWLQLKVLEATPDRVGLSACYFHVRDEINLVSFKRSFAQRFPCELFLLFDYLG